MNATNLSISELPARVQEALRRGETVTVSGEAGKIGEVVPVALARRRLGAMAGTARLIGDIESPIDEPWEVLQK